MSTPRASTSGTLWTHAPPTAQVDDLAYLNIVFAWAAEGGRGYAVAPAVGYCESGPKEGPYRAYAGYALKEIRQHLPHSVHTHEMHHGLVMICNELIHIKWCGRINLYTHKTTRPEGVDFVKIGKSGSRFGGPYRHLQVAAALRLHGQALDLKRSDTYVNTGIPCSGVGIVPSGAGEVAVATSTYSLEKADQLFEQLRKMAAGTISISISVSVDVNGEISILPNCLKRKSEARTTPAPANKGKMKKPREKKGEEQQQQAPQPHEAKAENLSGAGQAGAAPPTHAVVRDVSSPRAVASTNVSLVEEPDDVLYERFFGGSELDVNAEEGPWCGGSELDANTEEGAWDLLNGPSDQLPTP